MQDAIRKMHSTERKGTLRSVRIERIVKPSAPLTIINVPNEMQNTIRKLYSTERKNT